MDLKSVKQGETNLSPPTLVTMTLLCHGNHKMKEQDSCVTEAAKLMLPPSLKWYVHANVTCFCYSFTNLSTILGVLLPQSGAGN